MENIKKTLFEHLSGYVKNFTEKTGIKNSVYKIFELEPGMTPLMILHKILNKTRAWDRKIVSSIPKAIWKSVKGTYNLSKKVLKGGYRGVFSKNTKNLLRVLFGNAPIYDDDDTGSKVVLYFPERYMNIVEERCLFDRLAHFCPNLESVEIMTQSVYIIQCAPKGGCLILQSRDEQENGITESSTTGRLWRNNAHGYDFSKLTVV
jgi:hypothetical protein